MPSIAIIDDRKGDRETIGKVIRSTLKKLGEENVWGVVEEAPPARERDVLQWLDENDATVLVTDWRLNEGSKGQQVVTYEADKLVDAIRQKRPTFPIYIISGFSSEIQSHRKDVENIFNRKDFTKDAAAIVPQMIRAGQRRYEEHRNLLARMDTLAGLVASGTASEEQRTELSSLQGHFQVEIPSLLSIDTVMSELELAREKASDLRQKVESRLEQMKAAD